MRPAMENGVAGLNVIGMRRAGIGPEDRSAAKAAFKLLYRSGLNMTQAREQMAELFTAGPGREICDFVSESKRGVCGCSIG